jgi:hypothetical protein
VATTTTASTMMEPIYLPGFKNNRLRCPYLDLISAAEANPALLNFDNCWISFTGVHPVSAENNAVRVATIAARGYVC